jgi:hypothetical protein
MPLSLLDTHREEIHKFIKLAQKQDGTYLWLHGVLTNDKVAEVAEGLACLMVDYCVVSPALKQSWQDKRDGKGHKSASDGVLLAGFMAPIFGTPTKAVDVEHTQGAVAEFLWFLLFDKQDDVPYERVRLEGPDFRPTSPGGDGLGVYKDDKGLYFFKLWEIKKHAAKNSPRDKVTSAALQLDRKAISYLAQYSQVLSRQESDPSLALFYAELTRHWIDKTPSAGAGLSVSSKTDFPEGSFEALSTRFSDIAGKHRLTGVSLYIDNYVNLVEGIKKAVLEGLE